MQLETERLVLREFVEDDWRDVLEYQSKPEYGTYYEEQLRDEESSRAFVGWFIGWQAEQPRRRFQLASVLKATGRLIGCCGLRLGSIEGVTMRPSESEGVLGYDLDPAHWGHGYATEAAAALLDFGFETLSLHRAWSYCIAENERSAAVLRRLGFVQEGRLRQNEHMRGAWHDTLVFGLLASEWRERRRAEDGPSAG